MPDVSIIALSPDNIDKEDICCALSDKKCAAGVLNKKEWLKSRFPEGFVFKKANVRGKVFIEYGPAEKAWVPVMAPGYLFIQCFWVSGSWAGKGIGRMLLDECMRDSKDKNGIVVLSSPKKKPFLADKKFFTHFGFEVCDTVSMGNDTDFELLMRKNDKNAVLPQFSNSVKNPVVPVNEGIFALYSDLCPFTDFYIKDLENACKKRNIPFTGRKITILEEAQNNISPFVHYSLFYNGKFLTYEIQNEARFEKLMNKLDI